MTFRVFLFWLLCLVGFASFVQAKFYAKNFAPATGFGADFDTWLIKYHEWRCFYVSNQGGGIPAGSGQLRVIRPPPVYDDHGVLNSTWAHDTVSEGIAYGMLLAAYANDKTVFDGLWAYAKANFLKTRNSNEADCMHWHIFSSGQWALHGGNYDCATDAELDMIFALTIAHARWGSSGNMTYHNAAANLAQVVLDFEVDGYNNLKYGSKYWAGGQSQTNPSYFATGYWTFFASYFNNSKWSAVRAASYATVSAINTITSNTGLVPEWCRSDGTQAIAWEGSYLYSWNSIRFSWRIATDLLWYNNSNAGTQCELLVTHWDENHAQNPSIAGVGEESLTGGFTSNTYTQTDMAFISQSLPCALFSTSALRNRLWSSMYSYNMNDYYKDSLYVIAYLFSINGFRLPTNLISTPPFVFNGAGCAAPRYLTTINNFCVSNSGSYEFHVQFTPVTGGGTGDYSASTSKCGPWTTMSRNDWGGEWYQALGVGPFPIYVRAEGQLWKCPQCSPGGDQACLFVGAYSACPSSSPTRTPTRTRTPSRTRSISLSRSRTPSITPTRSCTASVTPSNTATPSVTPSNTATPSVTPSNTATPSVTPSNTATPSVTPSNTATPSVTPSNTATPSVTPSNTATPSVTPSNTASSSVTPSSTATPSVSRTATATRTPTATRTRTPSRTRTKTSPSVTATRSKTRSKTPSRTRTKTSPSRTKTRTPSKTKTRSRSRTRTKTSPSRTKTRSRTASRTRTRTVTRTRTRTRTKTSPSRTKTRSRTASRTRTKTVTRTRTRTRTKTSPSRTRTKTRTRSRTPSRTRTRTKVSPTRTRTRTRTRTLTPTRSRKV